MQRSPLPENATSLGNASATSRAVRQPVCKVTYSCNVAAQYLGNLTFLRTRNKTQQVKPGSGSD